MVDSHNYRSLLAHFLLMTAARVSTGFTVLLEELIMVRSETSDVSTEVFYMPSFQVPEHFLLMLHKAAVFSLQNTQ